MSYRYHNDAAIKMMSLLLEKGHQNIQYYDTVFGALRFQSEKDGDEFVSEFIPESGCTRITNRNTQEKEKFWYGADGSPHRNE